MKYYIGLDVSMKRTFICVLNEKGKIVHEGSKKRECTEICVNKFFER